MLYLSKNRLVGLDHLRCFSLLKVIGSLADEYNIEVFVVGGFVRDVLLERDNYDIDIVCLKDVFFLANKVAEAVSADKFVLYSNFGVAMLKIGSVQIEFVNARKESYNFKSRKPVVDVGTFEEDQRRRDFTINTLAIGLNKHNFGEFIDTFGGFKDLENGIIRTPVDPNITFRDDPLRMFRAIRFATQLNFEIESSTFCGIVNNLDRIAIISKERISDEINKIIMSKTPSIGFKLLSKSGILSLVMPYIEELKGRLHVGGFSHKDIFYHTLQVLDNIACVSENIWLRWAALLHDVAKPKTRKFDSCHGFSFHGHDEIGARMIKGIFYNLHFPKDKVGYVEKMVRLHLRPITIASDVVTDSAVRRLAFDAGDDFNDLMLLCRADITSHNPVKIAEFLKNFDRVEEKVRDILEKDFRRKLQPVITGEIIMKELSLKPGPVVGIIKNKLKEVILNGEIKNEYDKLHQYMLDLLNTGEIKIDPCDKIG